MSAAWDGRPKHPERTGPHWIEDKSLKHTACVVWCHVMEQWHDMAQTMPPKGAAKWWRYIGPCLRPAEVAAAVRDAVLKEREACATCRWWGTNPDHERPVYGDCRRYAPRDAGDAGDASWPETMHMQWCGEHTPREEAQSDE